MNKKVYQKTRQIVAKWSRLIIRLRNFTLISQHFDKKSVKATFSIYLIGWYSNWRGKCRILTSIIMDQILWNQLFDQATYYHWIDFTKYFQVRGGKCLFFKFIKSRCQNLKVFKKSTFVWPLTWFYEECDRLLLSVDINALLQISAFCRFFLTV